ncbi:helix-turn-helix transcriptional regulator [Paenibacillus sp. FSL L8-0493]|uniref:helix-turn-helix domain-containing protein n=1 Tax=Paenibacillus sp. FSL L8-0493 TaxID=2975333 RepID=UPI0030FD58CB
MYNPAKIARQEAGLSIGDAAERIGIPVGYLSQIENGQRQVDPDRAEKIAQVYKSEREKIFLASRYAVREVQTENSAKKEVG